MYKKELSRKHLSTNIDILDLQLLRADQTTNYKYLGTYSWLTFQNLTFASCPAETIWQLSNQRRQLTGDIA